MSVLAIFRYEVKPGRMADFGAKLARAAGAEFDSAAMPLSAKLYRSSVPGPDTGGVVLVLEYADMAAYGARTAFEQANADWQALFAATPDAPERLVSVELLSSVA